MAVTSVVATISGVVSYTDGSVSSFGATLDPNNNIPVASGSVEVFRQLWVTSEALVQATTNLLGTFTFAMSAPATSKTVRTFTLNIAGIVAYSDQTHGHFGVQYNPQSGSFTTLTGSNTQWANAIANATFKTRLDSTIESVSGSASLTLS